MHETKKRLNIMHEKKCMNLERWTTTPISQCEFSVTVKPSVGVEHLPIAEEELQELSRRAEAIAQVLLTNPDD